MRLHDAHAPKLRRDPEVQALLDETVDALARSRVSLQQSKEALIRANRDNDIQRAQLAELHRSISALIPRSPFSW